MSSWEVCLSFLFCCNLFLSFLCITKNTLLFMYSPFYFPPDEMSDPAASPFVWISKWVDYSDKYGFGYQLCDEGVGVMFNDTTKLIMLPNGK